MAGQRTTLSKARRQEEQLAWLFILPVVLGILLFQVYPILFSLYISFTDWNLLTPPHWVGFKNYVNLFTDDPYFFVTLRNTAVYALGVVIPGLALALVFAMLLNRKLNGQSIYRAIYFVPVVVPSVSVALLWQWIYEPNFGVLNGFLKIFGLPAVPWLSSTHWAMTALIIQAIWSSLGFNIVILLSGLQGISTEYYEAAELDGASGVDKFLRITLPLLSPYTFFVLVISVINAFQVFDIPFVMTQGGPANATLTVVLYLYNNAFRLQRMGLASAIGYLVFVIILVLTLINFRLRKRWVFEEGAR